jgi:hypothetical protein
LVHQVLRACITGLDDYTTDERGDVGSWIRMACIRGLRLTVEVLFDVGPSLQASGLFQTWLPPQTYQEVIGGILKQGVERLDNVRRQAGESFLKLLRRGSPNVEEGAQWRVQGYSLMEQLFLTYVTQQVQNVLPDTHLRDGEEVGWNEGQWLFPKAVRILEVSAYRKPVLRGLVLSVGSKTDSTVGIFILRTSPYVIYGISSNALSQ